MIFKHPRQTVASSDSNGGASPRITQMPSSRHHARIIRATPNSHITHSILSSYSSDIFLSAALTTIHTYEHTHTHTHITMSGNQNTPQDQRTESTAHREAARGSGVDQQAPMSGYSHLKKDDDGPPEAAWMPHARTDDRDKAQKKDAGGEAKGGRGGEQ